MKIKWKRSDAVYEVMTVGAGKVDLVVVVASAGGEHPVGHIFKRYTTEYQLNDWIRNGVVTVVGDEPAPLSIQIAVDTAQLDKALATAKELEATLLRIKELWPCSGS